MGAARINGISLLTRGSHSCSHVGASLRVTPGPVESRGAGRGWEARLRASEGQWAPGSRPGPQAASWAPAVPPGWPLTAGGGCSWFRLSHGWRPPSRSSTRSLPALQPRARVPQERSVFLQAAGPARTAVPRGQRLPQALCSASEPRSRQTELCCSGPPFSCSRELPSWPLRCSGRLGQFRPLARLCLARASWDASLWELFYFFGFCSSFFKKK